VGCLSDVVADERESLGRQDVCIHRDGIRCEEERVGGESDACEHLLQLVAAFEISRTAVSEAL
jgi:hypothetical protein